MKAVLCKQFGPPDSLVVEEVASPEPSTGEVVIAVRAASVNFPDVLIIQNKYQVKPPLPFSPGSELAGVVKEVGAGVQGFKPGDQVMAFTTYGAFAEEVKTDASRLLPLPPKMDFVTGAAFLLTYGTTDHALRDRGALAAGETLLVLGAAGAVGLSAVELGRVMGARVIAAASTPEKLALCRDRGADETIDYDREDLKERAKELTDGRGVDVVYDCVGGPRAEQALRAIAWEGRFLVIGFAAGIPSVPLNLALLKGCQIVGVFYGSMASRTPERAQAIADELYDLVAAGELRPHVSERYPLERAPEALRSLMDRRAVGKVVVTP
jgi:NADPH2:quinone reductase